VGAGVMGAGIAQWVSAKGVPVLLKDVDAAALARGLKAIGKVYREAVKRHTFTEVEARTGFDRITPVFGDAPWTGIDLVIEAAVEKLDLKQRIFRQLEGTVRPDTVLATNTSALSINAISAGLAHPERAIGLHFFNPVHRMQLVEIVRGSRTSAATVATAVQFAKALGKLPVLANDRPGFIVNRILMPYLVEAVRLFAGGCPVRDLDRLMLDFGMPMGPLRLCDEVGLDVALHVAKDLEQRLPNPVPLNDTLERMIARGWLGKKSGRGFYVHGPKAGRETPNPEAPATAAAPAEPAGDPAGRIDRLVLLMINEAARCLEENVVASPGDIDFAMIFGTGWAPFRGGPLRYADRLGAAEVVQRLEALARDIAPPFAPCERLRVMARTSAGFYSSEKAIPNPTRP
jgi:3-hydroxyacyl-CoA dehydrogenase/enoyl-CoA hydratase/3-hydroxybutyryl-CoA epimerase